MSIPRSVQIAIQAASRDVVSTIRGSSNPPGNVEALANTLEKFMTGMVSQLYPKVKASWVDADIDKSWTTKAAVGEIVDGAKLQEAFKIWDNLSPSDRTMLESINYSKFNGQAITKLQKESPMLYKVYIGEAGASEDLDLNAPALPEKLLDVKPPLPARKDKDKGGKEFPPAKQELAGPGDPPLQVGQEFDKGIPTKSI